MTDDEKTKCHAIIHTAAAATATVGAGLPLPGSDTIPITATQIVMCVSLAKVFDKILTEEAAGILLGSFTTAAWGKLISQALTGWIPGIGSIINAGTAAGLTEAIGWAVATKFDEER